LDHFPLLSVFHFSYPGLPNSSWDKKCCVALFYAVFFAKLKAGSTRKFTEEDILVRFLVQLYRPRDSDKI